MLEKYLPDWAYKVGTKWDSLVYIDGFAGPWETKRPDYADSSFGVAIESLRRCQEGLRTSRGRSLPIEAILVEQDPTAFQHLEQFAEEKRHTDFGVHPLCGDFVDKIPEISAIVRKHTSHPFRFVFLDPKGWADIPMQKLQPFLTSRSCEVLINLMTKHIIRFPHEDNRAESYRNLFGRPEVLNILRSAVGDERAEQSVREYCRSLTILCKFKYVSSAVILEPSEERIRYFLVYATHHPRGVEVFKAAEMKAARIQETIRLERQIQKTRQPGLQYDDLSPVSNFTAKLHRRYAERAREKVIETLLENLSPDGVPYAVLFCEAMAFPLVTPDDLIDWLHGLEPKIRIHFAGSGRRRKPSPLEDDRIMVVNRQLH